MKPINIGIIGTGAVTEIFHFPILKRTAVFNIKKVADLNMKRMEQLKRKFNLTFETTTNYREIFEDEEIIAVLVATPPHLHANIVIEAFENNKDVLCEKPLTFKLEEATKIIEKMQETSQNLVIGYNFRFIPQFKKICEISRKKLGTLIGVQTTFCSNAYAWPTKTNFQIDLDKGGGVLAEMGTHHIDLVSWILGRPQKVWCHLDYMDKSSPVYDRANLFIEYENQTTANINLGWRNYTINSVNVFGSNGYAYANYERARVLVNLKDLIRQKPIIIKAKIIGSPYQEEWLYFYKTIKSRKNPLFSNQSILSPVLIVECAYQSFKENGSLIEIGD